MLLNNVYSSMRGCERVTAASLQGRYIFGNIAKH